MLYVLRMLQCVVCQTLGGQVAYSHVPVHRPKLNRLACSQEREEGKAKKNPSLYICACTYTHAYTRWAAGLGAELGTGSWTLLRSAVLGERDDRRRALALVPRGRLR